MKNIFKSILLFSVCMFVSCEDNLDINADPTSPGQINTGLALTSAQASLVTVTGGELTNLGGFWAQYHTQSPSASQYENMDQYNLNTGYADRLWSELYAECLTDLQYVIDESNANGDTGTALMGHVLRAYTYQLLVDLFDDVPYTEATQGAVNITPAPTSGEEIYADLIVKIDEALAAYDANPSEPTVGQQDIIFESNMNSWIQFANTLKLKIYLRMAYTPQADPAAVNALLAENNFLTTDALFDNFVASTGKRNPFYEVQIAQTGLGDVNNVASNTLHNFYTENSDPRLEGVYRPNQQGNYVSIVQGSGNDFNNTAVSYSRPNIGPTTPVFLLSLTESYFLQAEALARYAGGAGAKEMYDMAVTASFATYEEYFGLTGGQAAAAAFIAPGGAYEYVPAGTPEATIRQIMVQKWAALPYVNNIEAYIETTRTKFPEVVEEGTEDYSIGNRIPSRISVLSGTQVPSILFYPDDEVNRNPNISQRNSLTENVWWDQKPEN